MLGDAGLLHFEMADQLPDGLFPILQLFNDPQPQRVGQRFEKSAFNLNTISLPSITFLGTYEYMLFRSY